MAFLLVNFGGPRNLNEIAPFLTELLQDRDVIRTRFPNFFHRWFFRRVAEKRALKIRVDYEHIGGKSPIYEDTESIAAKLSEKLGTPVLTFHRYIPALHAESLQKIETTDAREIRVLPLFPQFSYSTTGSIARLFSRRLSKDALRRLRWIQSYPDHPAFVAAWQQKLSSFLKEQQIQEEEVALLFSAHGLPKIFVENGDVYETEVESSFQAISQQFPKAIALLAYQSKFGRGEWLKPYTSDICQTAKSWCEGRKVVVVPLSFTSDHIETLFEIEELYLPPIREEGIEAFRCPALNFEPAWIDALAEIAQGDNVCSTERLIRSGRIIRTKNNAGNHQLC